MDRRYLLIYETEFCISGIPQRIIKRYEWFEDEEEMNDFIEENEIKPIEKFYFLFDTLRSLKELHEGGKYYEKY